MKDFGNGNGKAAKLYELVGKNGVKAEVTDFGATVVAVYVPDKNGNLVDVVCGYECADDYAKYDAFFGATVGRNANRIANAKITVGGKEYQLEVNDNENNLHSGKNGLHARVWNVKAQTENSITFAILDEDLSDDFPGNLDMEVTYTVTDENALEIHYHGVCDQDTICNFTNHSYFNLNGHNQGTVLNHKLLIHANAYTPVISGHAIPTGELADVTGTVFDFREAKVVGRDIKADEIQLKYVNGYDHNFVIDKSFDVVATLTSDISGIAMDVTTDLPGVQLYTGNFIGGQKGKGGLTYDHRDALCLETQYFPNAANEKNFESSELKAGEAYDTTTSYRFYLA